MLNIFRFTSVWLSIWNRDTTLLVKRYPRKRERFSEAPPTCWWLGRCQDTHSTSAQRPEVTMDKKGSPSSPVVWKPYPTIAFPSRNLPNIQGFKTACHLNCCLYLWQIKGRMSVILCITHCYINTKITYSFILLEEVTVSFHCTHIITVSMQGTCQMMHWGEEENLWRKLFKRNLVH